jgi:transposase
VRRALATLQNHLERVVPCWTSTYTNARLEGFNGLFQAARARARGYRNVETFMTLNCLIGSLAGSILKSTLNDEKPIIYIPIGRISLSSAL